VTQDEGNIWAEQLPNDCPPKEAFIPQYETYYRLVSYYPPSDRDFYSYKKTHGYKPSKESECIARSLSISDNSKKLSKLFGIPYFRNKIMICLKLSPESGVLLKTRGPHHFSWWLAAAYNPIPDCKLIELFIE